MKCTMFSLLKKKLSRKIIVEESVVLSMFRIKKRWFYLENIVGVHVSQPKKDIQLIYSYPDETRQVKNLILVDKLCIRP